MSDPKFRRYCRIKGIKGRRKKRFRRFLRQRENTSANDALAGLFSEGSKRG